MARRKLSEDNIRKLTRSGGGRSIGLTLPKEWWPLSAGAKSKGWSSKVKGGLNIRDYRSKK